MNTILRFPNSDVKDYRQECRFMNKPIQVEDEEGILRKYPCIVLFETDTNIPIYYTGLEKYLSHLSKSEMLKDNTLSSRAYAVCHFLNYLLKQTNINSIHECTLNIIRDYLKYSRIKEDGNEYNTDTWLKYRDYLMDFLVMYYSYNRDQFKFEYRADELKSLTIIKDEKHHKKATIVHNSSLYVKAPRTTHKKNRVLLDGYLDLLLYEAKKYEPDIALAIALSSYAGIREGEVVNLSCGSIKVLRGGLGSINGIQLDLSNEAPFIKQDRKKTNRGSIKKHRPDQFVYDDFVTTVYDMYNYHLSLMESKGYSTLPDAPLFVNKQGNPMSVQTYSDRVKHLFYERFLPSLKLLCEKQGIYADHAAYIETYDSEYPGAHMFRHWFTMYLLTKAKLQPGEIMKWRGDSSQESMNDYIHENADLIKIYDETSYYFQASILEEINR